MQALKVSQSSAYCAFQSFKSLLNKQANQAKLKALPRDFFTLSNVAGGGGVNVEALPVVKCSPLNNINHPKLNASGAAYLLEAVALLENNVNQLLPMIEQLHDMGFDAREFIAGVSALHNYKELFNTTLALEKNERIASYAFNRGVVK
jgi:hypothetical protein